MWGGYIALRVYVFPPPAPEPVAKLPLEPGKAERPADAGDEKAAKLPAEDLVKPAPEDPEPAAVKPAPASSAAPRHWVWLGSLDPKSPFKMGVTFISRGAAVERVELIDYKAIDDDSGYLGHLALTDNKDGGAVVNVVGLGTPAARATTTTPAVKPGLLVGDVITEIAGQPVTDATAVEQYLAKKTRPGQRLILVVKRSGVTKPITFQADLLRQPLEVVRPESHQYETQEGMRLPRQDDPLSLLLSLEHVGGRALKSSETEIDDLPSLIKENWVIEDQGADFVEFSYTLDEAALEAIGKTGGLKIVKRYTLARTDPKSRDAYHLALQVEIHNLGTAAQPVAYRLLGPTSLPLEGWWYSNKLHRSKMFYGAGARDIVWRQTGRATSLLGNPQIVSESKAAIENDEPPVFGLLEGDEAAAIDYAGVDTQFFAAVIKPQPGADKQPLKFRRVDALPVQDVMTVPKNRLRTTNVSVRLMTPVVSVLPDEPLVHKYQVFFGPKDVNVLKAYELEQLIEYGWEIFALPARLLQYVLWFLYSITQNYGIAIILLTVIVRSCMVPISLKQARAAAKMQELAPEIQKIKDKHPDDAMKQHAAVQELYKKHKFNPFGGCLLVFIQLPIFIGLYRCLSVDIDLRDASLIPGFFWASNLAGPDKVFYWKDYLWSMLADETGWLGPYFNILPIITVTLFLIQQKLFTPPATDEQTQMQQRMMTYMTVFMGVMFYKVPAGLCLYFIMSSLWGIGERKMLAWMKPKPPVPGEGGSGVAAKLPAKPASPNGSAKPQSTKKKKQRR